MFDFTKMTAPQMMFVCSVTHYLLHRYLGSTAGTYVEESCDGHVLFIEASLLNKSFPGPADRDAMWKKLAGRALVEDKTGIEDMMLVPGAPLFIYGDDKHQGSEFVIDIKGVTLTRSGIDWIMQTYKMPPTLETVLTNLDDAPFISGADTKWLKEVWKDPTGYVYQSVPRNRGIKNTTKVIRQLSYTAAEAAQEHARIDAMSALSTRSKAAYKANVTQRVRV